MIRIVSSGDGKNRDHLQNCDDYIALITPDFVSNDKCIGEMRDANALKKPMYALIDRKTKLPKEFHEINWNAIIFYSSRDEFGIASAYLKGLLKF